MNMEENRKPEEDTHQQYEKPEMDVIEIKETDTIVTSSCAFVFACTSAYRP